MGLDLVPPEILHSRGVGVITEPWEQSRNPSGDTHQEDEQPGWDPEGHKAGERGEGG